MGRHASTERRRSVAAWPVVVGVVVLVLVAATVGYFLILDRDKEDVATCNGTTVLPVVVAPGAAAAAASAAQAFNATKPVARSTCVSVAVTTLAGRSAVAALSAGWRGQRTPAPGLWIADSSADVAALDAANSAMTAGHPNQPLATSPVVLAVREVPVKPVSWASVADGSAGLDIGIANPAVNRASAAALESVVRGTSSGTAATGAGVSTAEVAAAAPAFARLAAGAPTVPATTDLALQQLSSGTSTYTAVPALESELAAFNGASPTPLSAVYPSGPTAGAQILPIPLTADWVTNAMSDAAAAFDGYLADAAGARYLTAANLRTGGAPGPAAGGVDLRTPVTVLPSADAKAGAAIDRAWASAVSADRGNTAPSGSTAGTVTRGPLTSPSTTAASATAASTTPASTTDLLTSVLSTTSVATGSGSSPGPAVTFLVDGSQSMSTLDSGAQRSTWVKSAISTVVQKRPADLFGLWSFSTTTTQPVPVGPPTELVGAVPRSSAIVDALNRLTPSGDSYTYGAIRTTFTDAANSFVAGRPNRVILLTDGSDSTPGLSRDAIKATVAGLVAEYPGLRLDIIGLSSSVNEQALTEIAAAGGGKFTAVDSLADLEPTLLTLVS